MGLTGIKQNKMKTGSLLIMSALVVLTLGLSGCVQNAAPEKKEASKMDWWEEARFGMFIHWGLYSIPAGEWNGSKGHAEWIRTTAQIPLEVYDTLVNHFNPVKFDAREWVRMAKEAGMKYIVITSKHHDGFCLFDSEFTDFDVMSTPFRRDILGELAEACHQQGIVLCFYHSIMDWHHPDYLPRREWEKDRTVEGADMERYIKYLKNELRELTTKYGAIGVLWFDGEWEETWTHDRGVDLYNYVDSLQPGIIINNRVDKGRSGMQGMTTSDDFKGDFGTPEQEVPATGFPGVEWESCITLNNNWGYNKDDNNWKTPETVIRMLADIASKGGNLLLNIGPKSDGTFPDPSIEILAEIGKWMSKNSASVYGTSASPFSSLGWGRCTIKPSGRNTFMYLHIFDWPDDGLLVIPGLANKVQKAYLLDGGEKLEFNREEGDITVKVPQNAPDTVNTVVVLLIKGEPLVTEAPLAVPESGDFVDEMSVSVPDIPGQTDVLYTLDGSSPGPESEKYAGPLSITGDVTFTAAFFKDGKRISGITVRNFRKVSPVAGLSLKGIMPGLKYEYFTGEFDMLPDFQTLRPEKKGVAGGVMFPEDVSPEDFALRFYGYVNIPADGLYYFSLASDDGSCMFINGQKVIDNDGLHGNIEKKAGLPLGKGLHQAEIQYFQKKGGKTLSLRIEGPAGSVSQDSLFFYAGS